MNRIPAYSIVFVLLAYAVCWPTIINIPADYPTIQQGIDASVDGDTVLVQPGTYVENINFNGHNIVLGSLFLTTGDTSYISQTAIDGDSAGTVVTFESGEDSTTVISGFTIQRGSADYGAGIHCQNSNPNIYSNIVRDNVGSYGSGIYCFSSDPIIEENIIKNNHGSGIHCEYSNALIQENMILENWNNVGGAGIYCSNSNPIIENNFLIRNSTSQIGGAIFSVGSYTTINNNTFSENSAYDGGAIHTRTGHSQIINSIIWDNSTRQISSSFGGTHVVNYCDVEGGFIGFGNIGLPPMFVNTAELDYNVCSQSPCIDAGDPDLIDPDGTRSDMGVFFVSHPNCSSGNRWYISTSGNDTYGTGSIHNTLRTIQHGINISRSGDTVIVLNGSYYENLLIENKSIVLASNYIFTDDSSDIVNTIINGSNSSTVVTIKYCDDQTSIFGFTITNGNGQYGGGIKCDSSNATIRNNIIHDNFAGNGGGGIYCKYSNSKILNNEIADNTADGSGGGIYCNTYSTFPNIYSSPQIINNIIKNNLADGGGGISCAYYSNAIIKKNYICNNVAYGSGTAGGGIHGYGSNPIVKNNIIMGNRAVNSYGGDGGGIAFSYQSFTIDSNTICLNTATRNGGGISLGYYASATISNNLFYINSAANSGGGICNGSGEYATIINNTVCNNRAEQGGGIVSGNVNHHIVNTISWYNSCPDVFISADVKYCNIQGGWQGVGNIDQIPQLFDPANNNYNVCSGSPCIDAGDPAINDPDGTRSDIGYFYINHPDCPLVGNNIYVSVVGDDSTGNGSPSQPYRTIVHAINQAFYHDTVIVYNGTYNENVNFNTMRISLVSNFVFTGDSVDIQNTIIDGDSLEPVITFDHHEDSLVNISGFTIKNGLGSGIFCSAGKPNIIANYIEQNYGSGIFCNLSNPVIQQNKIRNNSASMGGGGIHLERSSPYIGNNEISGNYTERSGGGIFCTNYSNVNISNNNISGNCTEGSGGGICCINHSDAIILDNNILNNSSDSSGGGIYCVNSQTQIENNNIINNTAIKNGGGIRYVGYSSNVSNNVISENIAQNGGGVWIYGNLDLTENDIYFNESDSIGGGIYCGYSNPYVYNNNIAGNNGLWGGGIGIVGGAPEINLNNISENIAEFEGGGVYSFYAIQLLIFNQIIGNIADFGAGIMANSNWKSRSYNNLIVGNSASSKGGGICCRASNHHIVNNTITNNSANLSGAGLYIENNSSIYASNVILWSNNSQSDPEISIDSISVLDISFSDIQNGWPGTGNIDIDPLFRNPANGDFHLMSTYCLNLYDSPCIDCGNPMFSDSLLDCMWGLGTTVSDLGAYGGGYRTFLETDENIDILPTKIILNQNYPNPFNAHTTIRFVLPESQNVQLTVYDLLGRRVEMLVNEEKQAGQHQAVWDASDHSSGIYFYRIKAGDFIDTKKMILLK